MKKIMFVCLGNICRSPLAHAVMDDFINQSDCIDKYMVDSSGTSGYHVGQLSDARMRKTAMRHNVEINHRAQQLSLWDIANNDYIFAMDNQNLIDILSMCNDEQKSKVRLLRDFDPEGLGDVPDPYYGGVDGFEDVFQIVLRSCRCLLQDLESGKI